MKIYFYCSYQLHPYGYHIGTYNLEEDVSISDQYVIPVICKNKNLITRIFEYGKIVEAYGKQPGQDIFFYLIKFMEGIAPDGRNLFLNFAFEFDDQAEYTWFKNNFNKVEFTKAASRFMIIDEHVNLFGFKIDVEKLSKALLKYLKEKTGQFDNKLYIVTRSEKDYRNEIYDKLEINQKNSCSFNNKMYVISEVGTSTNGKIGKKLFIGVGGSLVAVALCTSLLTGGISSKDIDSAVKSENIVKLEELYNKTESKKDKYAVERTKIIEGLCAVHISKNDLSGMIKDYRLCAQYPDKLTKQQEQLDIVIQKNLNKTKDIQSAIDYWKVCHEDKQRETNVIKLIVDDVKQLCKSKDIPLLEKNYLICNEAMNNIPQLKYSVASLNGILIDRYNDKKDVKGLIKCYDRANSNQDQKNKVKKYLKSIGTEEADEAFVNIFNNEKKLLKNRPNK